MEIATTTTDAELLPPNPIRVETALSRYPVHRLAKHGNIAIDIREESADGQILIRWDVDYSGKRGQPGPLAYKLDTLIINRRIEEARRPIPRIIKLGSLNDICRELGLAESGKNTNHIKNSLHQNASAYITAKIRYKAIAGTERSIEFGDTRYGIVFTGEKLPDGRTADAVYIILHDFYIEILDNSITRPLDYDYLKSLPPAPQRFYELLSYQMYAAIKNDRHRAKLLYSEFCTYAPQTRHFDWERVRSQMNKIYRPHKESGYITKVDYQDTTDGDSQPDWIMLYQPGSKARAEYRAFTKRGGPVMLKAAPFTAERLPQLAAPEPTPLEKELIGYGITPAIAAGLIRDHSEETIRLQIESLQWLIETKPKKIADRAAYLVTAIKNGYAAPKDFVSAAERQAQAEAKRLADQKAAEDRRRQREQEAHDQAMRKRVNAYIKQLGPVERASLEAEAMAAASQEQRENYDSHIMARFRDTLMLAMLRDIVAEKLDREQAPAEASPPAPHMP